MRTNTALSTSLLAVALFVSASSNSPGGQSPRTLAELANVQGSETNFQASDTAQSAALSSRSAGSKNRSQRRVELRCRLFMADQEGKPIQVTSERSFSAGDRLRILVEWATDANLYVFAQEGTGPLLMLFPDLGIRQGKSELGAGSPLFLPGRSDRDWFIISGSSSAERLFIVLSADRIEEWPTEKGLLDYPSRYRISRQEFDQVTAARAATPGEKLNSLGGSSTDMEGASGNQRGPRVSTKSPLAELVLSGAGSVVQRIDIRVSASNR